MDGDTVVRDGIIETKDLRLATWLYLNQVPLAAIKPDESSRCSFSFRMSNAKLERLMNQWAVGHPNADIREVINAYLYLVHRGKELIRAREDAL
jgi:hypothetical protein